MNCFYVLVRTYFVQKQVDVTDFGVFYLMNTRLQFFATGGNEQQREWLLTKVNRSPRFPGNFVYADGDEFQTDVVPQARYFEQLTDQFLEVFWGQI